MSVLLYLGQPILQSNTDILFYHYYFKSLILLMQQQSPVNYVNNVTKKSLVRITEEKKTLCNL